MFWNSKPKDEPKNEKVISIDMTNPESPKVKVGAGCSMEDVGEFFFRTTFMFEADQYIDAFEKDKNPARVIGEYIQNRTREYLIAKAKDIVAESDSEDDKDKPIVSPLIS